MSLFQNSTTPLHHQPNHAHHLVQAQPRPILKRARTPYQHQHHSSVDVKRRRTSPSRAFSRLSLSPVSQRAATDSRRSPSPSESYSPPSTHFLHHSTPQNRSSEAFHSSDQPIHPSCQHPFNSTTTTPPKSSRPSRPGYSAYEPEPNRIVIESLSEGSSSPTPSLQLSDDDRQSPQERFEIHAGLAKRLTDHQRALQERPSQLFLRSPSTNDQQLVLYKRPPWPALIPTLPEPSYPAAQVIAPPEPLDPLPIDDQSDLMVEVLDPKFEPLSALDSPDPMEID